jgi:hypothetical protein
MGGLSSGALALDLTFDDRDGDGDGVLDGGEIAQVFYEVSNHSDMAVAGMVLELRAEPAQGIDLDGPVQVGDLAPGESQRGALGLLAQPDLEGSTLVLEGRLTTSDGQSTRDRLQLAVESHGGPERAYVWFDADDGHGGLMATGSVRIQTVLTGTGRYAFVADTATRERIQTIVETGGGSVEDRLRSAIEAANQENIRKVFQLSVNPVAGDHVQLVLAVYTTGSSDRIFLRDAAVDSSDALQVLEAFDQLAQAFVEWDEQH